MNLTKRLFLFWKIGKSVFKKQNYYENVVSKYSAYLSYYFGMSKTFSIGNINYMKKFYKCFPNYYKELEELSFDHYKLLVDISGLEERYFYFRIALFCRSTVSELSEIINEDTYFYI